MTSKLPDFYDISWTLQGNEPKLRLLTDDGIEYRDFPFDPYFFIRREDLTDRVIEILRSVDESAYLEKEHDEYQGKLWKVSCSFPTLVKNAREKLEDINVQTFEADIPYSRRVMIDLDQPVSTPDEILSFDMEIHAEEGVPDVDKADKRVLSICAVGSDGKEYAFAFDDETETLEDFIRVAQKYKCVIGWNSIKFDYPYLVNRSRNLGVDFDPFTVTHVDAFPTYRRILLKRQNNYRLDYIAEQEFDWSYGGDIKYAELHEYFENDRKKLVDYNLDDARVVKRLNDRYRFKDITFDILASNGFCRPRDIFYVRSDSGYQRVDKSSNVLIEGAVLRLSQGDNGPRIVWPNKGSAKAGAFTGAKVFDPTPGLHPNVIVLDFASMYPSIIWALNVGPETFRENDGDIKAPTGTFVSEPRSRFAEAYDIMKSERDTYTNRKKKLPRGSEEFLVADSLDRGLKTYVNTFYGVQGSAYSRFYDRRVAEAITLMGQNMLDFTSDLANAEGYDVIYGDTDSVLVSLGKDPGDPVTAGQDLADMFTVKLRDWVDEEYNGRPERIDLELDEVYETFFMTDSRKRYAGFCIWDGSSCFTYETKGFETVRGDWPDAPSEFQDELLQAILSRQDTWPIVERYKKMLFNGELDEKLVKRVMLRSEIEEYKSTPPHVRVAKRQRDNGNPIRVGDRIPYIKYGNKPREVEYAGEEGRDVPDLSSRNYEYLWNKYFKSIMKRLGVEEHEQTGLGDFVVA